jgi:hypothetical protein
MANATLYVETTIVSYLTAWPGRDLVVAARQQITGEWWKEQRHRFSVFASQFVLDEASQGDPDAARRRLDLLKGIPLLKSDEAVVELAEELIRESILPAKAVTDAFHISLAAVHRMDYLLTWNCRHLANAEMAVSVGRLIRGKGYEPSVICTPDELMGG